MNKEELSALVAEILRGMEQPQVKGSDYKPRDPGPQPEDTKYRDGDFVEDVSALDLRKLYLTENPENKEKFARMKEKTPARLGSGKAYKYPHDYPGHWVKQQYLPDDLKNAAYYTYGDNKTEQAAAGYWARIKGEENKK